MYLQLLYVEYIFSEDWGKESAGCIMSMQCVCVCACVKHLLLIGLVSPLYVAHPDHQFGTAKLPK